MTSFHSPSPPTDEARQRLRLVHDWLSFSPARSQLARSWAGTLLLIAACQFAYFTLFPFNFMLHLGKVWDWRIYDPADSFDWIMNLILAFPLGFALALLAAGWGWTGRKTSKMFLLAGVGSCLCSTAVECLQLMLAGRVSALADILSNTAGGLFGCFCFLAFGQDFLRAVDSLARTARRRLIGLRAGLALLAVIALVCAVPAYFLRRPRLATWNDNFPLLIGNEKQVGDDGSRQWSGSLTNLHIANRAADLQKQVPQILAHGDFSSIMGDSEIAHYALVGPGPYPDQTHRNPDLAWAWEHPPIPVGAAAHFSYQHFLETPEPAAPLVKAITATDAFTIAFDYAADSLDLTGPARMISISRNIYTRDLTIGQDHADLIVRLRTRGSGSAGQLPEWHVPRFFRDTATHRLLVSYDGNILRVYQDMPQRLWRVRTPPEYSILWPILARDNLSMPINGTGNLPYVWLFYFLADLPVAFILGLVLMRAAYPPSTLSRPPSASRLILPNLGLVLAVTALYITVDRLGIRALGWTEFPLSAFILAIETAIFGHWWSRGPARPRATPPMAQILHIGDAPARSE